MKKHLLLFLFLGLIAKTGYTQNFKKNLYFGIGISSPRGKLSKAIFTDSSAGYGTTGLSYALRYEMVNEKGWGPYIDFQNASIGFDADLYAEQGARDLGSSWNWSEYSVLRYNVKSFNAGMQYTLNNDKRFKAVLHAGLGLSICRNASTDVTYVNVNTGFMQREKFSSQTKLNSNLNFGFMLVYDFKSNWSVFAKFNFQNQNPNFKTRYEVYFNGIFMKEQNFKSVRPMYFSTTNFGVAYRFSK